MAARAAGGGAGLASAAGREDSSGAVGGGGDAANYRAHFQAAVDVGMALAVICNDAPRGSGARVARWFCPGVPMHVTGEQVVGKDGRVQHVFLVPAQAALLALERGLITWLAE